MGLAEESAPIFVPKFGTEKFLTGDQKESTMTRIQQRKKLAVRAFSGLAGRPLDEAPPDPWADRDEYATELAAPLKFTDKGWRGFWARSEASLPGLPDHNG